MRILLIIFILHNFCGYAQMPFKYKLKKVAGEIYGEDGCPLKVKFKTRQKLLIQNCNDPNLDTLLRSLVLAGEGRKQLEFLLTTSSKIKLTVSEKVGLLFKDGKYRLIGGISGPDKNKDHTLLKNESSITLWTKLFHKNRFVLVYRGNTIELFKGSIVYGNDRTAKLSDNDVKIFDWNRNKEITFFSLDTILIEPLANPDMMYKNFRELYYFCGVHEIYHTTPANIELQEEDKDSETDALEMERKAFKKRLAINRKKLVFLKS
jgi:hypothetical protein